jgi:hypothetical protein
VNRCRHLRHLLGVRAVPACWITARTTSPDAKHPMFTTRSCPCIYKFREASASAWLAQELYVCEGAELGRARRLLRTRVSDDTDHLVLRTRTVFFKPFITKGNSEEAP